MIIKKTETNTYNQHDITIGGIHAIDLPTADISTIDIPVASILTASRLTTTLSAIGTATFVIQFLHIEK